nr:MAG TPA: hypothetical protein [Caudoviricetes sp.]
MLLQTNIFPSFRSILISSIYYSSEDMAPYLREVY